MSPKSKYTLVNGNEMIGNKKVYLEIKKKITQMPMLKAIVSYLNYALQ